MSLRRVRVRVPSDAHIEEEKMYSKYRSWTTPDLLAELKRLKEQIKKDHHPYGSAPAKDNLRLIINVLRGRGL